MEVASIRDEFTDDLARQQAYLVSRGVRPMALLPEVGKEPIEVQCAFFRIQELAAGLGTVIPFVWERPDHDCTDVGYVSHSWVLDLHKWLHEADVPTRQYHRIMGLLLGYSPEAIAQHDNVEFDGRFSETQSAT